MIEYKQALPQSMFSDLISSVMICMVFSSEEDKNERRRYVCVHNTKAVRKGVRINILTDYKYNDDWLNNQLLKLPSKFILGLANFLSRRESISLRRCLNITPILTGAW